MKTAEILKKSSEGDALNKEDLIQLLSLKPSSPEALAVMAQARRISDRVTDKKAEVHGQFALDLAPCSANCEWCSFAAKNGVFPDKWQIDVEDALECALKFEEEGANAVLVMTTADYPLSKLLEIGSEIRKKLNPSLPLIANTGDKTLHQAMKMVDAGFHGVYHALHLDEQKRNALKTEKRLESMRNFQEAGLAVGTCVEPVGPEHSNEELAEMMLFTASIRPAFSGAARRIPVPNTAMAELGTISELRMAQIVAVTRLAMPRETRGNCTHEPCTLGAIAGATLFWAEVGANPRDDHEKTEEGRGKDVAFCKELYNETETDVLEGGSLHFMKAPVPKAPSGELIPTANMVETL